VLARQSINKVAFIMDPQKVPIIGSFHELSIYFFSGIFLSEP
jgi:hypothetical protein